MSKELQTEKNTLDDDKKKLAAENKEFAKTAKDFKKEIENLKKILMDKKQEIQLIKLAKELEKELERCSGIKPSEDENGIIAEFLNEFKNDVYELEIKYLKFVNNIPKNSVKNANQRKVYLEELISELTKLKIYSTEYTIKKMNLTNMLSDKLINIINKIIDEGIKGYLEEMKG